jgi:signal transduction histidine kinase
MEAAAIAIENARLFDAMQVAEQKHRDLFHGLINAQEQDSKLVAEEWQDRIGKKLFNVGLTNELHPSVLDDFGVAAAIREYVADVLVAPEERDPMQVTVQADDVDQQLPNEAKLLLFRITQEALRNIRKHAGAKNVQIAFVQEHSGVSLMIKDDGKGFNPSQSHPGHFGLQYMRERAEACGGTFRVVSSQGQGTEVHINFPST